MYKTVRQGDASLQYTILPQVDQFYVNELPSIIIANTGSPIKDGQRFSTDEKFRVTTGRTICLTLLIVAMFVCCAVGAYLIDEMVNRRCAVDSSKPAAPLANGHSMIEHTHDNKNNVVRDNGNSATTIIVDTSSSNIVEKVFRNLDDDGNDALNSEIEISTTTILPIATNDFDSETTSVTTPDVRSTLSSSTKMDETTSTTSSSLIKVENSGIELSSDVRSSSTSVETTESIVNMLKNLKMSNSPRVTLKLTRITDTVPQMYLKPGIASYKNGKITTSVLAQGLTLEGIIFKTPDGTINPWPEKWPFEQDETDAFRQKGILTRDLTALALLMGIVVILVLLVVVLKLVKSAIERWHNFDGARTENRDEAHSTLLDAQIQDPEDKE